jgi:hypothetical protein
MNNDFTLLSHHIDSPIIDPKSCEACHGDLIADRAHPGTSPSDPGTELQDPDSGAYITNNAVPDADLTAFCVNCHDSNGAVRTGGGGTAPFADSGDFNAPIDIKTVWNKAFGHRNGAECMDCHGNSGAAGDTFDPKMNAHGSESAKMLNAATEYAICASTNCHAKPIEDYGKNIALEFDHTSVRSGHPVLAVLDDYVNSPAPRALHPEQLTSPWDANPGQNLMTCGDCHNTDNASGAQGPHGSGVKWMLAGPNKAWPYTDVNKNGSNNTTGFFYLGGPYTNLFCMNCHPEPESTRNNAHNDSHHDGSRDGTCVFCHIRVPHGGKVSRLIATSSGTPVRLQPYGNGGLSMITIDRYIKANDKNNYRKDNCDTNCGEHGSISGGESW